MDLDLRSDLKRHVLITGGAGFIGSRLTQRLHAAGHRVRVLDVLAPQIHGDRPLESPLLALIRGKAEFIHGSVTDADALARSLEGIDTVVHFAAETGTGQSMYAIRHYVDVNVGGTALLLDLIANKPFPVRKLVVASSRAIYGEGKYRCGTHGDVYPSSRTSEAMQAGDFEVHCPVCDAPATLLATDEASPPRPSSIYGITKLNQEQMVLTMGQALNISALAYRYQNVYGPGQSLSNPYTGILSIFSTRMRNGAGINIFEDGLESRDFVYIEDVVDATFRGIEHVAPMNGAFNVGSGVGTDVVTVANTLQNLLGTNVPIEVSGKFRVGDIRHNVADLKRVRTTLGFAPSVDFQQGLSRFVAWVKGEPIQVDRYQQSIDELRAKGLYK
jgi:dTDP-L-rhamnose 4-epimerase